VPSPPEFSSARPRKILVRGVNWLGDAVMTTPALQRLREAHPAAEIVLLTPVKLADLWKGHPAVNRVFTFEPRESVWSVGKRLRSESFDVALVFPNSPRSALETFLAEIPERIGYRRPWRNAFLTRTIPPRPESAPMRKRSAAEIRALIRSPSATRTCFPDAAHHVHDYLYLAAALGANPTPLPPLIAVAPEEVESGAKLVPILRRHSGPVFGLNPGAEYGLAKRWPADRFVAAAVALHQQTGCAWLIFGGAADRELVSRIEIQIGSAVSPNPILNLAGATTLRQLCALLKRCDLLLTNDTGPMHLAAAVGTPVVVPFGSTSPELTHPGIPGDARHQLLASDVPCAPCFLRECPIDFRCMKNITVEEVVAAALRAGRIVS